MDGFALAETTIKEVSITFRFYKEGEVWKIDLSSIMDIANKVDCRKMNI